MNFYLQHGYGKGNKIETLALSDRLAGVLLSPADEDFVHLKETAKACRQTGLDVWIDPQTYLYSGIEGAIARNHGSNGIAFRGLHWSQDASSTQSQVTSVGDLNQALDIQGVWIAPSVLQTTFSDAWTPLALQLARTAASQWGPERTFATLVIDEAALSSRTQLVQWLDLVTTLDVRGFYLLVQRASTQYPPSGWQPERLANLLYMIYTLTELNGFELHWGYSDAEGLLGLAVGATSIGSGWSFGLRQFSTNKWVPKKGGKAATIRVPMSRLWSSIRADGEAQDIFSTNLKSSVFTAETLNWFPTGNFGGLDRSSAQDMYLDVLARQAATVGEMTSTEARLDFLQGQLARSVQLHEQIEAAGITLEARYFARVRALRSALEIFRASANL